MVFDDLHHDIDNDLVEAHGGQDVEVKKFNSPMNYVVRKNWLNSIPQTENIGNLKKTLKISNFIPNKDNSCPIEQSYYNMKFSVFCNHKSYGIMELNKKLKRF